MPTSRALKTFVISVKDKELLPGPWKPVGTEAQVSHVTMQTCDSHVIGLLTRLTFYGLSPVHTMD